MKNANININSKEEKNRKWNITVNQLADSISADLGII